MTPKYVKGHPDEVYALFKDAFLDAIFEKGPSKVHYQIAELEQKGLLQGIMTQNLDYLHNLAGSQNVVAFMGSFADTICLDCGAQYHDINVWRGEGRSEANDFMKQAQDMIEKADLLVVIGTTGFHSDQYLKKLRPSTKIVQINPGSTMFDEMAVLNIRMDAEQVFDQILTEE